MPNSREGNQSWITRADLSLESRVAMLNADQWHIFDVKRHLHQQQYEEMSLQWPEPLRMFVSGIGGTGKSFLIEAIKALIAEIGQLTT